MKTPLGKPPREFLLFVQIIAAIYAICKYFANKCANVW